MMPKREKPSSRRLTRAGLMVVVIVLAVFVLVVAGRNVWHSEELKQEQQTGVKEHDGSQRTTEAGQ